MGKKQPLNPQVTIMVAELRHHSRSIWVFICGSGWDEKLLFDCGPATTWKLARAGISTTKIYNVFFTTITLTRRGLSNFHPYTMGPDGSKRSIVKRLRSSPHRRIHQWHHR
ncbi:MAG: hypothetical protein Ct9H300mP19_04470 [Dehalococcoidia bacterium]|nr:MAG: hypothetical protein Ct9H300mP19_04470 [Dehalococcoidia bacterium]